MVADQCKGMQKSECWLNKGHPSSSVSPLSWFVGKVCLLRKWICMLTKWMRILMEWMSILTKWSMCIGVPILTAGILFHSKIQHEGYNFAGALAWFVWCALIRSKWQVIDTYKKANVFILFILCQLNLVVSTINYSIEHYILRLQAALAIWR